MKVVGEAHASCVHTVAWIQKCSGSSRQAAAAAVGSVHSRFAMRELGSLHYRTVSNWRVPYDGLFG